MSKRIYNELIKYSKDKYSSFINDFSKCVINEEASIFIGTGLSMNSGLPSWKSLLKPCLEDMGIENIPNPNLYKVAQYYANKYSDSRLRSLINQQINNFYETNEILEVLLSMKFKSIWTTNYDNLIENELKNHHVLHNVISEEVNLSQISTYDKINIYKINGDYSNPNKMVLTQNDYENYERDHSLFLTFLKKELVSNTFLFIGYSFTDQIILDCLSSTMNMLGGSGNLHYAFIYIDNNVTKEIEYQALDLKRRYNVEFIFVNSEIILDIVKALKKKVNENKIFISGAYYDVDQKVDHFADLLSKELVVNLIENDNRISTGVGRRLGTYVTGYAHQYLAEKGISNTQKYLSMRPFPFHLELTNEQKVSYRTIMEHDCSTAIFLFGQSEHTLNEGGYKKLGHHSFGVYQEFEIAKKLGLKIIPVGSTGFESEIIWNEVKNNINEYYYLSKKIDALKNENDPKRIVKLIMAIINQQ